MRFRSLLAGLLVLAGAAVCVRLGFWQLSRLQEKQALNALMRSALAGPPVLPGGHPPPLDSVRGRMVRFDGRFDEKRHFLLSGRAHGGAPGVHVLTPLLLHGDSVAVIVDRGWLGAPDAATARPQDVPEPGVRIVTGVVEAPRRVGVSPPLRTIEAGSVTVFSLRWADLDSIAARLPYRIAPYLVRETPGPGVPSRPLREAPRPHDEMMHLSYAIQWFSFAAIMLVGSAGLAWSRRGKRAG